MKKMRFLSVILSLCLLLQCVPAVCAVQTETQASEPGIMQPVEIPFGQVCVQRGCRTINGMVPLGGSDYMLDTAQAVFLYEVKTDTVVYSYNPDMRVHPGSLAKMVLSMIVLEECELDEVVTKHFVDSLLLVKVIPDLDTKAYKCIDVGTGAGFPGIPLKIAFPETEFVLMDSLNKRIGFLNRVIELLDLKKI